MTFQHWTRLIVAEAINEEIATEVSRVFGAHCKALLDSEDDASEPKFIGFQVMQEHNGRHVVLTMNWTDKADMLAHDAHDYKSMTLLAQHMLRGFTVRFFMTIEHGERAI